MSVHGIPIDPTLFLQQQPPPTASTPPNSAEAIRGANLRLRDSNLLTPYNNLSLKKRRELALAAWDNGDSCKTISHLGRMFNIKDTTMREYINRSERLGKTTPRHIIRRRKPQNPEDPTQNTQTPTLPQPPQYQPLNHRIQLKNNWKLRQQHQERKRRKYDDQMQQSQTHLEEQPSVQSPRILESSDNSTASYIAPDLAEPAQAAAKLVQAGGHYPMAPQHTHEQPWHHQQQPKKLGEVEDQTENTQAAMEQEYPAQSQPTFEPTYNPGEDYDLHGYTQPPLPTQARETYEQTEGYHPAPPQPPQYQNWDYQQQQQHALQDTTQKTQKTQNTNHEHPPVQYPATSEVHIATPQEAHEQADGYHPIVPQPLGYTEQEWHYRQQQLADNWQWQQQQEYDGQYINSNTFTQPTNIQWTPASSQQTYEYRGYSGDRQTMHDGTQQVYGAMPQQGALGQYGYGLDSPYQDNGAVLQHDKYGYGSQLNQTVYIQPRYGYSPQTDQAYIPPVYGDGGPPLADFSQIPRISQQASSEVR